LFSPLSFPYQIKRISAHPKQSRHNSVVLFQYFVLAGVAFAHGSTTFAQKALSLQILLANLNQILNFIEKIKNLNFDQKIITEQLKHWLW
jgi:hypothetical protein